MNCSDTKKITNDISNLGKRLLEEADKGLSTYSQANYKQSNAIRSQISSIPPKIRVGDLTYDRPNIRAAVPLLVDLNNTNGVLIVNDVTRKPQKNAVIEHIIVQLSLSNPKLYRDFICIDCKSLGKNNQVLREANAKIQAKDYICTTSNEVEQVFDELDAKLKRFYCGENSEFRSIYELNTTKPKHAKSYTLVYIKNADFSSEGFKSFDIVNAITRRVRDNSFADAGIILLIEDKRVASSLIDFNFIKIIYKGDAGWDYVANDIDTQSNGHCSLLNVKLFPRDRDTTKRLISLYNTLDSENTKGIDMPHYPVLWDENSDQEVAATIGQTTSSELWIRLGGNGKNNAHHMLIGGATGYGKSNFLHALIYSLTVRYSPNSLQLILLDFKQGVEFNDYRRLPHTKILSGANLADGLKILIWINEEITRRGDLFKSQAVTDIESYNDKIDYSDRLPRLLVIMDEFQALLAYQGQSDKCSDLIDKIGRLGRSFGINMVLCSQSLLGVELARATYSACKLRVCFRLDDENCDKFLKYNNNSPTRLDVGEAVYNDDEGHKEKNMEFRAYYLDSKRKLANIEGQAREWKKNGELPFDKYILGEEVSAKRSNPYPSLTVLVGDEVKDETGPKLLSNKSTPFSLDYSNTIWASNGVPFDFIKKLDQIFCESKKDNVLIVSNNNTAMTHATNIKYNEYFNLSLCNLNDYNLILFIEPQDILSDDDYNEDSKLTKLIKSIGKLTKDCKVSIVSTSFNILINKCTTLRFEILFKDFNRIIFQGLCDAYDIIDNENRPYNLHFDFFVKMLGTNDFKYYSDIHHG